jgi:serine/threonine protein kinase
VKPALLQSGQQLRGERGGCFRVLEWIGEGSYARVYRALDGDQFVALKLAKTELSGAREQLQLETAAHRALKHPVIPALVDTAPQATGEARETTPTWLARAWIEGDTLHHRLDGGRALALVQAVPVLLRIADALATMHAAGWTHGDVRPQNVLLAAATNQAFLVDLGEARPHRAAEEAASPPRSVRRSLVTVIRPRPVSPPNETLTSCSPATPRPDAPPERDVHQLGELLAWSLTGADPHADPHRLNTAAGFHPVVVRLWEETRDGQLASAAHFRDRMDRLARQLGIPSTSLRA